MSRKVCVLTSTRADYGLLRWLMKEVSSSLRLELQVIAAGMHLSEKYGQTWHEIEDDGFNIDERVSMDLEEDSPLAVSRAMGQALIGFAGALDKLQPDILMLLGDRFEILAAASAALLAGIPVGHIHGGEVTEGAMDESLRHAITKMSQLHFVAARSYQRRVLQMGEIPEQVYLVGGLGVDAIQRQPLLKRSELEKSLGHALGKSNLLVTWHPETLLDSAAGSGSLDALLAVLEEQKNTHIIITLPNADPGNNLIRQRMEDFAASHEHVFAHASLGQLRYLSLLKIADAVLGNSSSGLLEAPTLGTPTVNIGDRQRGRLRADSVIDCKGYRQDIRAALDKAMSPAFQEMAANVENPYGRGGAASRIVEILESLSLDGLLLKPFNDLSFEMPETSR
ncbi:UDP-N-acetylglucosamine 2-epimerase [Thiolapillus brandeum]|uniref:UDP-N-acetylglucosamine 2-epimerase n=1 Tax=Thiolapillus brandeum TaxID=1076588 RepID=A0A7U6GHH1_9GAMM|nr:UDP-N-acetylglucosamine 2-epimerase [Thiolapillus brandeum]BAO43679.1 UDP-N-acetylglucosamine 2-epimerase [Thiolapillus brandeum]